MSRASGASRTRRRFITQGAMPVPILMQRLGQGRDGPVDQRGAVPGIEVAGQDAAHRRHRYLDRLVAHFGPRLGLVERDALDPHAPAPVERRRQIDARLGDETRGLGAGLRHDRLGFLERVALSQLVLGEALLRLLGQALGLVEPGFDLGVALVERGQGRAPCLVDQERYGDDEGDQHPEFALAEEPGELRHHARSLSASSTAAATCDAPASLPASLAEAARATSTASSRNPASALVLAAWMRRSAASLSILSCSASVFCCAAASALNRSAVSRNTACAWARASASAFS